MERLQQLTARIETHRKQALAGAGALLLLSALLALFSPGRAADYQSIALLLYAGNAAVAPGAPALSAVDAARVRFDNTQLLAVMDQFDLYPELRQEQTPDEAVAHMRARLSLLQPDSYSLQIAFRDASSARSQEVANALAQVLQTEILARADSPAPAAAPASIRSHRKKEHAADPLDAKRRQLASIETAIAALNGRQSELQEKSADKQRQIAAAGSKGVSTRPPETEPPVDPYAAARMNLQSQLAIEKQRLANLLDRYTEAYPDVIDTRDKIAQTESKLAALPAPPSRHARPLNLYQHQVDELTAEESQIGEQLRINERDLADLQRRREEVLTQLALSPSSGTSAQAAGTDQGKDQRNTDQAKTQSTPSIPPSLLPAAEQVRPFHILQGANLSVAVGTVKTSRLTTPVLALASLGLLSLLFLLLLPRISFRDRVITTPEQLRKNLPAHVVYFGDVYGSDH